MSDSLDPKRCSERVSEPPYYLHSHQCKRKPWKDGLCKQHHPDTRAERNRKRREIADEKRKNSAWFQLGEARRRIADLERELAEAVTKEMDRCCAEVDAEVERWKEKTTATSTRVEHLKLAGVIVAGMNMIRAIRKAATGGEVKE